MSQRLEFVLLAQGPGVCFKSLCQRFGISRKSGYKWLRRYAADPKCGLLDRSRRPKRSPRCSGPAVAAAVVALRQQYPGWSGYKLRRVLQDQKQPAPAASTCTEILRRAHLIGTERASSKPYQRFERASPNELWQMDYKGHFATQRGPRCHPFTMLDDHSRFNLSLEAHHDQTGRSVQAALERAFTCYGLPEQILCDNGTPWGQAEGCPYTALTVWLLRLGVRVTHGRPYHPQTQGKEERFHRSLDDDLLTRHTWRDLAHCAQAFRDYRQIYNCIRPHLALAGDQPVRHYQPSVRAVPASLPPITYDPSFDQRRIARNGQMRFAGRIWQVGAAFAGLQIGLRPSPQTDLQWEVYFSHHRLGQVSLATPHRSIYSSQQ